MGWPRARVAPPFTGQEEIDRRRECDDPWRACLYDASQCGTVWERHTDSFFFGSGRFMISITIRRYNYLATCYYYHNPLRYYRQVNNH